MEWEVDLGEVDRPDPARPDRIVGGEVAAGALAAKRALDQVGLLQAERREDAPAELVGEARSRCSFDHQPQREVVAAVVGPSLARREETGLLEDERQLLVRTELPAVSGIPSIRLPVEVEVVEAARVVQKLAHRDARDEGRRFLVEVEPALRDQLEDECGDEDLRDAADPKSVLDGEHLAGGDVREPDRSLDPLLRPDGHYDRARNAGRHDRLELILDRSHASPASLEGFADRRCASRGASSSCRRG